MIAAWDLESTLGAALMGTFGLLFALGGAWMAIFQLRMRARATGHVVGTELGPECETLPVVTFNTAAGTPTRLVGDHGIGRFHGPRIGQSVPIRYDPADPDRARIATFGQSFTAPLALLAVGLGMLALLGSAARDESRATAAKRSPNDRIAAYIPLKGAAMVRCVVTSCRSSETTRSLRDFDRAIGAALRSPATSSRARRQIANVQRALRPLRRGRRSANAALRRQTVRLYVVLESELLDLRCGRSCQRHFVATH